VHDGALDVGDCDLGDVEGGERLGVDGEAVRPSAQRRLAPLLAVAIDDELRDLAERLSARPFVLNAATLGERVFAGRPLLAGLPRFLARRGERDAGRRAEAHVGPLAVVGGAEDPAAARAFDTQIQSAAVGVDAVFQGRDLPRREHVELSSHFFHPSRQVRAHLWCPLSACYRVI
jgi:hypothetical protein